MLFRRLFKRPDVLLSVPFYKQDTHYTCGPTSLQMVFEFFGVRYSEKDLAVLARTEEVGTSHGDLIAAVTALGFHCYVNSDADLSEIKHFLNLGLPVIVNYMEPSDDDGHYSVVVGYDQKTLILHDPWNGPYFTLKQSEFIKRWYDDGAHASHHWLMVVSDKPFNIGRQYAPEVARIKQAVN